MGCFYNMDCLEGMKNFEDNYFDLAIVDPPYGGGATSSEEAFTDKEGRLHGRGRGQKYIEVRKVHRENAPGGQHKNYLQGKNVKDWDIAPGEEYFKELFRVSKNQIIWGGNYFNLPPTRCFLVWRKLSIGENFTMAMCEYAWTSFNDNAKLYEQAPQDKARFHPTQKPVELYEWILNRYAKRDDKILDTHCGSASSLVACERNGYKNYVGFEIDDFYYKKAKERLEAEKQQQNIFDYF